MYVGVMTRYEMICNVYFFTQMYVGLYVGVMR
jgi:hypothetical protein